MAAGRERRPRAAPMSFAEAASLLQQVGNVYHSAALFDDAAATSPGRGWDGDARVYLQRAVPLIRRLDQPYNWMLSGGRIGLAALLVDDTEANDALREELTLSRALVVPPAASEVLTGLAAVDMNWSARRGLRAPPRHIARPKSLTPWPRGSTLSSSRARTNALPGSRLGRRRSRGGRAEPRTRSQGLAKIAERARAALVIPRHETSSRAPIAHAARK